MAGEMAEGRRMKCERRNTRERRTGVVGVSKKSAEAGDYSLSVNICPFKLMKKYCLHREYLLKVCNESLAALRAFPRLQDTRVLFSVLSWVLFHSKPVPACCSHYC